MKISAVVVAISVATGVAIVGFVLYAFKGGAVKSECEIRVTRSTTYEELHREVECSVSHLWAFDIYARRVGLDRNFHKGRYVLRQGMSVIEVARMFRNGWQTPIRLVVGHARTLPQLAGRLALQVEADSLALVTAMHDKTLRKELGYERDSLIAMFVPNTYEVLWDIAPEALLSRLSRENETFWNASRRERLSQTGLSRYEAMTLASIVYEETKAADEMPRIAGVYMNRLRKGIPLQACPTVKYAMGDFELRRILYKQLNYSSPYNTYINRGLPPAPICIPAIVAIDAVLNYERGDYLYFCARAELDGRHTFSRTLAEHNAASRRYAEAIKKLGL